MSIIYLWLFHVIEGLVEASILYFLFSFLFGNTSFHVSCQWFWLIFVNDICKLGFGRMAWLIDGKNKWIWPAAWFIFVVFFVGWTCYQRTECSGCKWVHWALLWISCVQTFDHCKAKVKEMKNIYYFLRLKYMWVWSWSIYSRECPADLKEGIASLIFASPRCSEIPELVAIRNIFEKKYGKDFVSAATDLRPNCGVNRMVTTIFLWLIVSHITNKIPNWLIE